MAAIKFRFGPAEEGEKEQPPPIFSEIEKILPEAENLGNENWEEEVEKEPEEFERLEEHCSELWNQIKDAGVLEGADLSDTLLARLQLRAELLAEQVHQLHTSRASQNAQLRLACVWSALEELRKKKERAEVDEIDDGTGKGLWACMGQLRRWLHQQEMELARIREQIPFSQNSLASLRELELEQKAQQERIQKEGRAKHQQLCSLSSQQRGLGQGTDHSDRAERLCEALEQRYLALWLASLESLELITHFGARIAKKCPSENQLLDSDLEEGPDPKRRKTSTEEEEEGLMAEQLAGPKLAQLANGDVQKEMQLQKSGAKCPSDIGYSSGENNSLHEGTTNQNHHNNTTLIEGHRPILPDQQGQHVEAVHGQQQLEQHLWSEQIALSSELEKSFYRTVPLDEFGMTDLDTDEGPRSSNSSYMAQKFMLDELEKGGGGQGGMELSDSLIVHVDVPDSRQLNDFEEVMDLMDQQNPNTQLEMNQQKYCFSEDDDCESNSTESEQQQQQQRRRPLLTASRKRALPKVPIPPCQSAIKPDEPLTERKKRQNGRRKWVVRKSRSSNDGWTGLWNSGSNYMSSDFEWDEDVGMGRRASRTVGLKAVRQNDLGQEDEELPSLDGTEADGEPFTMARKRALCAFRDGLRQAAKESGSVSVRLHELLALVDKSLGGVDSAAYLLAELKSTFVALSGLCQSLETRMGRFGVNGESEKGRANGGVKQNNVHAGQIEDIQSELMLCHERMNALETTCNNLALLLGSHFTQSGGNNNCCQLGQKQVPANPDYLAQFAAECNRIREEVQKLKERFGEKFVFCSIQLPDVKGLQKPESPKMDSSAQTTTSNSLSPPEAVHRPEGGSSFWRSYLLLCLLGFLGWLYANSLESSTDWRWSFGPQLHYENGAPPV